MTGLSIKDYLVVKAKLPYEELHHQFGDQKGEELTDVDLMKILNDYYGRNYMLKRLLKFKKDLEDIIAILQPTVLSQ